METDSMQKEKSAKVKTAKIEKKKTHSESLETKQRYIYIRKDEKDSVGNLIDELLHKCNQKTYGALVDFSALITHALNLIKDSDIQEIQNNSLSDEDRAHAEVRAFNNKNGTNYTLYEFVLNGAFKRPKKGVNHEY